MGPPGAGKGTQAANLSQKYHIPAISTGAIIRNAIHDKTPLGIKAESSIEKGQLVENDVVIDIIKERISQQDCENGYILDGFPRTIFQAKAVDEMGITFHKVINIEVPDEEVIERILGRRECKECGSIFHTKYNPSAKGEYCENCGSKLSIRADDTVETIRARLKVYHSQTEPLKAYYQEKAILLTIRGREKIEDTTAELLRALGE